MLIFFGTYDKFASEKYSRQKFYQYTHGLKRTSRRPFIFRGIRQIRSKLSYSTLRILFRLYRIATNFTAKMKFYKERFRMNSLKRQISQRF